MEDRRVPGLFFLLSSSFTPHRRRFMVLKTSSFRSLRPDTLPSPPLTCFIKKRFCSLIPFSLCRARVSHGVAFLLINPLPEQRSCFLVFFVTGLVRSLSHPWSEIQFLRGYKSSLRSFLTLVSPMSGIAFSCLLPTSLDGSVAFRRSALLFSTSR